MKKLALAAIAALMLSGCSATPETPAVESTPVFDDGGPNGIACRAFYVEWPKAVSEMDGDGTQAQWDESAARIDDIALKAEGDVKERMLDLVNDWPDLFDVFIVGNIDEANRSLGAIERACNAAGENIDGMQLAES